LRDRLLQNFRYYTNIETNPSQTWTRMEAEAFWEMFKDYEEAGGNGYMHSNVRPEMERLIVVEVGMK
jgi:chloramphenicol 3-O-phosphotransferase